MLNLLDKYWFECQNLMKISHQLTYFLEQNLICLKYALLFLSIITSTWNKSQTIHLYSQLSSKYFHNFKFKNEPQNFIKIFSSSGILTCNNACTHENYPILRVYANQCMIYWDFFVFRNISLFMELFLRDKHLLSFMCQSFLNIASLLFKPYQ